jgi:hypothetical protein
MAYMAGMERLYAVDLAVAADDGNDGGGGRGGKAGAPGGEGIARVNGQAAATAAAVDEEEEEGAADRDGNHATDGDGGPIAHSNRKDSKRCAIPHGATSKPYASLIRDKRSAHEMCTRGLGLELSF